MACVIAAGFVVVAEEIIVLGRRCPSTGKVVEGRYHTRWFRHYILLRAVTKEDAARTMRAEKCIVGIESSNMFDRIV